MTHAQYCVAFLPPLECGDTKRQARLHNDIEEKPSSIRSVVPLNQWKAWYKKRKGLVFIALSRRVIMTGANFIRFTYCFSYSFSGSNQDWRGRINWLF
jgi:hypothetical protein